MKQEHVVILRKIPSLGIGGLTIAVNLLQSTLAPVEAFPSVPVDFSNPKLSRSSAITHINIPTNDFLNSGLMGFNQYDWPNPAPIKSQIIVDINSSPAQDGDLAFSQKNWPNPQIKGRQNSGFTFNLISEAQNPFNQLDWPNPLLKTIIAKEWNNNLQETTLTPAAQDPFYQTNWPNPLRKDNIISDFGASPQEDGNPPFIPAEWRNPLFNVNPATRNKFWANNNLQDTLSVTDNPFISKVFENPIVKKQVDKTWINVRQLDSIFNIISTVHFNPPRREKKNQDWIQSRPQYYVDEPIRFAVSYPNPQLKKKGGQDWKQERPSYYVEPGNPLIQLAYPNPLVKARIRIDWIFNAPFQQIFTKPIAQSSFDLPVLRRKPKPQDIIQARPSYYVEPGGVPFIPRDWPNPTRRMKRLIIRINTGQISSITVGNPFRQLDWQNPLRKKVARQFHIHTTIIDESITAPPNKSNVFQSLVPRKKYYDASWIYGINIPPAAAALPIKTFDWPNPVLIERPTLTHLINLLQLPFNIPPGEKPFHQEDFPNPLIARKIHHQGWIWDKRFYYTEEPLQPNQYDWPIFRAVKRAHVGFIDYKIGISESVPFTTSSIFDVPLRKIEIAKTWIDNPILVIITPIGLQPFRQNEWPLFLRVKRASDLITWLGQNPQILLQIKGRVICLLADEIDYNLEAMVEEFDLEARVEEFDLEAGGDTCE